MTSIFKDGLYSGRHVFVSGGTSGINLTLATAFGKAGAKVTVIGRKADKLEAAVKSLTGQGIAARGSTADVRDFAAVDQALAQAVDAHGKLDVVVCGAAGNFPAPAAALSPNGFKSVVDIDLLGTFNVCRAAFERFNTPGASVINISAPQATQPWAMQAHVCAAKAGVELLTKSLALEWGPAGIRVNAIVPGPIDETEGMDRLTPTPESKTKLAALMPLQRMGTKDDVAQVALFLASPAASYVTGSVYAVDGGMMLVGGGALMQIMS